MNLEHKRISTSLILTLTPFLCFPAFFPELKLLFFSPFLIILFYKESYVVCMWAAFFCGFFLDILSSNNRLGIYAIDYCLTTLILYNQKKNFFADSLTTLPLMTFLFSSLSTAILFVLTYTFEQKVILTWSWITTDLIYMPAVDAFYAFIVFIVPFLLFGKRIRRGKDYFSEGNFTGKSSNK